MTTDANRLAALQGIANACCPTPGVITGGQPTAAQLRAARDAGIQTVLDIRDPMEPRPYDEAEEARALGLRYINVPVTGGTLNDGTMERILEVVREADRSPLLFHCGSGNRVAGALIPFFLHDRGMTEEEATTTAMRVGLRGADMLEWGLGYAGRHPK